MDSEHEKKEKRQIKSPIRIVFEKLSSNSNTGAVYGEPIEVEGKKVVPVSKITIMGGGGAGSANNNESKESNHGEGEGGGGFISVKPVGVYEITDKKTRFIPMVDLSLVFMLVSGFLFMLSLFSLKKSKRKTN